MVLHGSSRERLVFLRCTTQTGHYSRESTNRVCTVQQFLLAPAISITIPSCSIFSVNFYPLQEYIDRWAYKMVTSCQKLVRLS